jgi:hypothetical protein
VTQDWAAHLPDSPKRSIHAIVGRRGDGIRLRRKISTVLPKSPLTCPCRRSQRSELIINLKTAKALGISFPLAELGRADQVIE